MLKNILNIALIFILLGSVHVAFTEGHNIASEADSQLILNGTTTGQNVELVGLYETFSRPSDVELVDNYAYLAVTGGFHVVDVSTPSSPVQIGFESTQDNSGALAIDGEYAYMGDGSSMRNISIATPVNPTTVGVVDLPYGDVVDIAVDGEYAFISYTGDPQDFGAPYGWVRFVNVSNPSDPTGVYGYYEWNTIDSIVVVGNYLYLAESDTFGTHDGSGNLRVFDISTPSDPQEVAFIATPGQFRDMVLDGDMLYVADPAAGVGIVDVSVPSAPVLLDFCYVSGYIDRIALQDGLIFVTGGTSDVKVMDCTNPAEPLEVGFYETSGFVREIEATDEYIYIATNQGMHVLEYSNTLADVVVEGESTGYVSAAQLFTATVQPPNASVPITYTWEATDQAAIVQTNDHVDSVEFTWASPGVKTVMVSAENISGTVTATTTIEVVSQGTIISVTLDGAADGLTGIDHSFTAMVQPADATVPITYTWSATEQGAIVHTNDVTDSVSFQWANSGVKTVMVSAENSLGTVTATVNIDLSYPNPLTDVTINGEGTGVVETDYLFEAMVQPMDAGVPITFTWTATDHDPIVQSNGLSDTVNLRWENQGRKTVTVTADNGTEIVSESRYIGITSATPVGITDVTVEVDEPCYTNTLCYVTATVSPFDASLPITYRWTATGYIITQPNRWSTTTTIDLLWSGSGVKPVELTVTNQYGSVSIETFYVIVYDRNQLVDVTIDGTATGSVDTAYTFTSTAVSGDPILPITYTWEATDQETIVHTGGATDIVDFEWDSSGSKTVMVTAENSTGVVTETMQVEIIEQGGIFSVELDGNDSGVVDSMYLFTSIVQPMEAGVPITYTWSATEQDAVVQTNGLTDTVGFQWARPGMKTVMVVAKNISDTVTATHTIELSDPYAMTAVTIDGVLSGHVDTQYSFTSTIQPTIARIPITYTWTATGYDAIVQTGDITDVVQFEWDLPGTKMVTVSAENIFDMVTTSTQIEVIDPNAMTGITIDGVAAGNTGQTYLFTSTVRPADARVPITYTWTATDHGGLFRTNSVTDTAVFHWDNPGEKIITVSAENRSGTVTNSWNVVIVNPGDIADVTIIPEWPYPWGDMGQVYSFTANVQPVNANVPITYTWSATEHDDIVQTSGLTDTISFVWYRGGTKIISVTVENSSGVLTSTTSTLIFDILSVTLLSATADSTLPLSMTTVGIFGIAIGLMTLIAVRRHRQEQ